MQAESIKLKEFNVKIIFDEEEEIVTHEHLLDLISKGVVVVGNKEMSKYMLSALIRLERDDELKIYAVGRWISKAMNVVRMLIFDNLAELKLIKVKHGISRNFEKGQLKETPVMIAEFYLKKK